MKAGDAMQLYLQKERNFRGQNLIGKSFRGKDLSGADFSRADIRGADFTNAILRDAIFVKARAGLPHKRAVVLVIVLLLLSGALGLAVGSLNTIVELIYHGEGYVQIIPKWLALFAVISFGLVALRHGLTASFMVFIAAFLVAAILAYVSTETVPLAGAIAIAILIASSVAVATAAVVTLAVAAALASISLSAVAVVVAFGIAYVGLAVESAEGSAVGIAMAVALLSLYLSQRILQGSDRYALFRSMAMAIVVPLGTTFRGADLTNADFTQAILRHTDFRDVLLNRTHLSKRIGADIPSLIS